jgi:hypothetical protein
MSDWDQERFGEASLGEAQAANPPDDDDMIEPDADPLDTDVEDADLFLGDGDDEYEGEGGSEGEGDVKIEEQVDDI